MEVVCKGSLFFIPRKLLILLISHVQTQIFMNDINNQTVYWNSVALGKTFTHPIKTELLKKYFHSNYNILDYGCGYGRITSELYKLGFTNITGVDTSVELIGRGKKLNPGINLVHIEDLQSMPVKNETLNAVILFAVLTCIPSNVGQKKLIAALNAKLAKGGIFYISDYYLQGSRAEVKAYEYYNNDQSNYGVFTLDEGATFRHHSIDWIKELLSGFDIIEEKQVEVKTMNGHVAEAFQIIVGK